jgi:O-antigen/teichoic acid export membrane protein
MNDVDQERMPLLMSSQTVEPCPIVVDGLADERRSTRTPLRGVARGGGEEEVSHRGRDRWLTRGTWALVDQGLFTLTNFGLNILLARWLSPEDYGAFTVAFALFLLLGALHIAVLIEPLLIFGPSTYENKLSDYFDTALSLHWGFVAIAGVLFVTVGFFCWLFGAVPLSSSLTALAVVGPFILLLWLLRGMCYVRSENIFFAVWGSGLYLVLMVAGIACLFWHRWLSATSGIYLMGGASSLVSVWLSIRLGVHWRGTNNRQLQHEAIAHHWQYGRWSAATYACVWIPENLFYLLLSSWGGLSVSAALRALVNPLLPLLRLQAALVPLLLTLFARTWTFAQVRQVRQLLCILTIGALIYWLLLGVYHRSVMAWLYDGQYQEFGMLLWVLGLVPFCGGVSTVLSAVLRARNRPELVFWAHATAAVTVLTAGIGLVAAWGTAGAVWGMGLTGVVNTLVMWRGTRHVGWAVMKDLS